MIILGLDPGIGRCGFGVIDTAKADQYVRAGCITTLQADSESTRLAQLGADLEHIIRETHPDAAVVEALFFGKNHKTAMAVSQARGVLLYVLEQHGIPVQSLTPLQIKSRLTGYGNAPKEQIQHVITRQLHLDAVPTPDDAADALAAALCAA